MKVYCIHKWEYTQHDIICDGILKFIPAKLCNSCHTLWLQGDAMPEVEIGYTKE